MRSAQAEIQEDTERDYIMTAEQGKAYGIIDEVIRKQAQGACKPRRPAKIFPARSTESVSRERTAAKADSR